MSDYALTKQLWEALYKIASPSTLFEVPREKQAEALQLIACTAMSTAPAPRAELDWSSFVGPKRNVEWKPDDQELIYTALNYRDDEYGDQDEDAGQQIIERLLSAWNRAAVSEQFTFEIAARLLKERDAAEAARAEEWRLRRDAEGSRDASRAAADTLRMERDETRSALKVAINHIEHMDPSPQSREAPDFAPFIEKSREVLTQIGASLSETPAPETREVG
ncbi:hypothetical protein GHK69_00940 [Sinorhizobium meliloti]|uniref:hypothetical protein n=1 Tax=Rhizobium meliloti TaxID=382 RepID=UPI001296FC6E|nr:hypothetical protein [Sinorhizobium meliloti]MQW24261.1 hypothetical protein [Sinorhizobium meliloti]